MGSDEEPVVRPSLATSTAGVPRAGGTAGRRRPRSPVPGRNRGASWPFQGLAINRASAFVQKWADTFRGNQMSIYNRVRGEINDILGDILEENGHVLGEINLLLREIKCL